jgi:hypothetical protein
MRPLVVEFLNEAIELALLLEEVFGSRMAVPDLRNRGLPRTKTIRELIKNKTPLPAIGAVSPALSSK